MAYELMNEAVAEDHESWNNLVAKAFKTLRAVEPERTIVIGSNRWQSTETFDALKVPENDRNIILSFHLYEPFLLTHYGASWTDLRDYNGRCIILEHCFPNLNLKHSRKTKKQPQGDLSTKNGTKNSC